MDTLPGKEFIDPKTFQNSHLLFLKVLGKEANIRQHGCFLMFN